MNLSPITAPQMTITNGVWGTILVPMVNCLVRCFSQYKDVDQMAAICSLQKSAPSAVSNVRWHKTRTLVLIYSNIGAKRGLHKELHVHVFHLTRIKNQLFLSKRSIWLVVDAVFSLPNLSRVAIRIAPLFIDHMRNWRHRPRHLLRWQLNLYSKMLLIALFTDKIWLL